MSSRVFPESLPDSSRSGAPGVAENCREIKASSPCLRRGMFSVYFGMEISDSRQNFSRRPLVHVLWNAVFNVESSIQEHVES